MLAQDLDFYKIPGMTTDKVLEVVAKLVESGVTNSLTNANGNIAYPA